ncbi:AvrPphF family type III effector [Erwinia psidii]|uniref:Type III effector n=1 Tax=Erwinia psidii TaxID=69224 RepID=A0A3N6SH78_9GAMM|nr:AvrPphF family type III effector [Erwinia psidii]MCX8958189.1 type III effector [Erwinia psidii]MCX8963132.1 type III effector [Erwinia psidii]MCX8966926.1 type III effector [Erwinia psidii]RQM38081.1 type III effector [Erwinia psidii]
MGNVCGTSSGSHHVYSPAASPARSSGASSPAYTAGGQHITSVYQLSNEARANFLYNHDPMQSLGLHSETPLYRTTDRRFLKGGQLAGNPKSVARIALHEKIRFNPQAQYYGISPHEAASYQPQQIRASELKDPSLNVMVGPAAEHAVSAYAGGNHVAVKMRLGDFLEKGGKVYTDVSAVGTDEDSAHALIVTLPKGQKVPAEPLDD